MSFIRALGYLLVWLLCTRPRLSPRNGYERYMQSPEWRSTRRLALQRDGYRCCGIVRGVRCGVRDRLQVHHLSYKHFGHEAAHLEDLKTLCRTCHRRAHGR